MNYDSRDFSIECYPNHMAWGLAKTWTFILTHLPSQTEVRIVGHTAHRARVEAWEQMEQHLAELNP